MTVIDADGRRAGRVWAGLALSSLLVLAGCRAPRAEQAPSEVLVQLQSVNWNSYRGSRPVLQARADRVSIAPRQGLVRATAVRLRVSAEVVP